MSQFKLGDRVAALDEPLEGVVVGFKEDLITVEADDGFKIDFWPAELLKIDKATPIEVSNFDIARIKTEKESSKKKKRPVPKPKERNAPAMEVDLHIHQLISSTKGMSKFDILNLQLETAKRQLEFAMRKRIQKIVFIHGVGEGVLKEELMYLFKRYDNLRFYDADYQKYGLGATEVHVYQNP